MLSLCENNELFKKNEFLGFPLFLIFAQFLAAHHWVPSIEEKKQLGTAPLLQSIQSLQYLPFLKYEHSLQSLESLESLQVLKSCCKFDNVISQVDLIQMCPQ